MRVGGEGGRMAEGGGGGIGVRREREGGWQKGEG